MGDIWCKEMKKLEMDKKMLNCLHSPNSSIFYLNRIHKKVLAQHTIFNFFKIGIYFGMFLFLFLFHVFSTFLTNELNAFGRGITSTTDSFYQTKLRTHM